MQLAFLSPSPMELLFIAVLALIVLGPKRLPEVARSVGHGLREMRESFQGASGDEEEDDEDEDDRDWRALEDQEDLDDEAVDPDEDPAPQEDSPRAAAVEPPDRV